MMRRLRDRLTAVFPGTILRNAFAAAICAAFVGCSTYEVSDLYVPVGDDEPREIVPQSRPYGAMIAPDTRLYSLGVFGAPLIPTRVRTGEPTSFELMAWLDAEATRDFSFSTAPCLHDDDGRRLCPYEVEVSSFAREAPPPNETDAERRWREMRRAKRVRSLLIGLDVDAPDPSRIDRGRIYRHFQLEDATVWERFRVELVYRYRCGGPCPSRMRLSQTELIEIDGRAVLQGERRYERRRTRDYEPAAQVQ